MTGIKDLRELLCSLRPELVEDEFVFCTVKGGVNEYIELKPICMFVEKEGVTLILRRAIAQQAGLSFDGIYRQITLSVHSSLDAVGLTAAVADKLMQKNISANVVAAYYHDHIFVQANKAEKALMALSEFSEAID